MDSERGEKHSGENTFRKNSRYEGMGENVGGTLTLKNVSEGTNCRKKIEGLFARVRSALL